MKNIGYYYSDELKTLIIGFEDSKGRLHGKVLGNTFEGDLGNMLAPFSYGYRYNSWHEGFIYVGKLTTYTTLKGYFDFLDIADYEQIKAYFLSKQIILEQHNSFVRSKIIDGRKYKYVIQK
jgi:hypothetical protein